MIRGKLTIQRTTTTRVGKVNTRLSEDRVKVLTREEVKVAVIHQEEVAQDHTTILIRITNNKTTTIVHRIIKEIQTSIRRLCTIM
jgi:hypothetical protein